MAISSSTSSASTTSLDQQLATLQKDLTTEQQSKDDAKTKETKEQNINIQIESVDDEIASQKEEGQSTSTSATPGGLSIRV